MINVTVNEKKFEYSVPPTLEEVAKDAKLNNVLAANVNSRLRELNYVLSDDADVKFLGYDSSDAVRIYETTLRYVIAKAVHNLYPKSEVKFSYSVSRSILAEIDGLGFPLDDDILLAIKTEVDRIIKTNYKIERRRISVGEATRLYTKFNMHDKVEILKYREEEYVNLYECDGYYNYMFGYMLPETGYLKTYNMFLYNPGFLIQYPRAEFGGKIPEFIDEPVFGGALRKVAQWGQTIGGNTIPAINSFSKTHHDLVDFVNMCETKHNQQLVELGKLISDNKDDIRLIAIAGPSSSGKTTFSNRLRIELKTRGIKPIMISIDDYYLGKHQAPKNPDGSPDLEHINALDVELFNKDMAALIRGEEVELPKFNFSKNAREKGKKVKVKHDEIIIIEGIHALNSLLTKSIPNHQKFKVYIAPQTQLHIDNQNPISITDLRLLRRLVRDQKYRNSSAEDTFDMWPSVRKGEFKWIYPYQKEANYVFNSELTYEFGVLKKHAVKQLRSVESSSKHFITANRLLKFLKYFKDIEDELVPVNSLLREFIGGSSFAE
ncbi:nucleoside kinase [Haploplasma axanthum]|uniref:Uridine kinase n=1 Tax=Haploplasma axanthum TaxID=29552 RepID=A0A449BEH9_HAPAX|nr:nucleoside kinase [Haploplasma axanthum]VEU80859.1 uridine kinase [Haploplasma axanthum]